MEKREIIKKLELFADLLEFNGENPFKIRAFRNGANVIRRLEGNIEEMVADGTIENVKGIGKGISAFLKDLILNGESAELINLLDKTPNGIPEILAVKGLGAKKLKLLFDELGIDDLEKLEKACKENKLALLKGFGAKTEEKILNEIKKIKEGKKYLLINKAKATAEEIVQKLNRFTSVRKVQVSGELRRNREIIGEILILVLVDSVEEFAKGANGFLQITEMKEEKHSTFKVNDFERVSVFAVENESEFSEALLETTGSKEFLQKLNFQKGETEKEFFAKRNLNFVPPEMREEQYFTLPEKLRTPSDLCFEEMKGMLHFHTVFSDGLNGLEEMITEAGKIGFEYAAVCDHSKSAYYANGLSEKRIFEQKELVQKLNQKLKFKILQGIESDILNDGSLDYPEEILKELDFVVASVHSNFGMSEREMTERIIKAVENPYTDVLGHPTGRLLLRREAYKVDIKKVIDACAENSVAIEINANPYRLDLDWRNIYYAREKDCLFAINADAHSTSDIYYTRFGIMIAKKAGVLKKETINYFNFEEFVKFLNRKVKRNGE